MEYLAYLPFQDYGCQVLIRVIRVKNVISFQGYFEQIPLNFFFFKEHKRRGRLSGAQDFAIREAKPWPGSDKLSANNPKHLSRLGLEDRGLLLFSFPPLASSLDLSFS